MGMKLAQGRARGLHVHIGDSEIGAAAPGEAALSRNDATIDVRQGRYPTFARGGLAAPGSQVPAGIINAGPDPRVQGFTSRPLGDARSIETGDAYSGVADDESRAETDARSLAERNASVSSLGSQRSNKGKRKPSPLIGLEHSSAIAQPVPGWKDDRQRNIEMLRDKLGGRIERNASTSSRQPGLTRKVSVRPIIGNPVLQRSTSTQVNGPRMLNVGQNATREIGGLAPVLPGIPKRSNTLDHALARTPKVQLTLSPPTAKSVRHPNLTGPAETLAPPPKSPAKSLAGSFYSSILPWTKSSRPSSPNEAIRKKQPPVSAVHQDRRQNLAVEPNQIKTRPRPPRVTALAGTGAGVPGPRAPSPLGLDRSHSGCKVQKKPSGTGDPPSLPSSAAPTRNVSLGTALHTDSPLTTMIESVKAKTHGIPELSPKPSTISPSPPSSPPIRPVTTHSMYPNPSLRSSRAQMQRADSTRSAKSARTAMGVRFDLEKRHSLSDEDLMSPDDAEGTSTPRSAGFRIPGTKLTIPFPSTPRQRISQRSSTMSTPTETDRGRYGLVVDTNTENDECDTASPFRSSEIEAARPESVASLSSAGSMYHRRALDDLAGVKGDDRTDQPSIRRISERAGLPKRSNTVVHDADKQARRSHAVVLGGNYIDGGQEKGMQRGPIRRSSSTGTVM